MSGVEDAESSRHDYRGPYTLKNTVPTVQEYKSFKEKQRANLSTSSAVDSPAEFSNGYNDLHDNNDDTPFERTVQSEVFDQHNETERGPRPGDVQTEDKDTSEVPGHAQNAKQRRKEMKNRDPDRAEREVTDPITHLKVTIRDFTDGDLEKAGQTHQDNHETPLQKHIKKLRESMGEPGVELEESTVQLDMEHRGLERAFPPPGYQNIQRRLTDRSNIALRLLPVTVAVLNALVMSPLFGQNGWSLSQGIVYLLGFLAFNAAIEVFCFWSQQKQRKVWEEEIWAAQRRHDIRMLKSPKPESVKWLNRILGSIWPLVNPEIFASLMDLLEDVMQASLPRLVRMVSVDDLGQGSEPLRILGIKWLPQGAAAKNVSADGRPTHQDESKNSAAANGGNEANDSADSNADSNLTASFQAEEGEFVNVELAFAYRSSGVKRKFRDREKNAHLYLAFYLPGGIKFPVWVEVNGIVGTLRARLQLTPDPPFVALCTTTFLGQPKVDLSCVPLVKRGLNIMDLPIISSFVQSSVDAAVSEYVAPKSLTLDLKSMLAGDDFKHDTAARGVVIVRIKRATDFKASDLSVPLLKEGSSDAYVSVGWAKFGKPMFVTRVIVNDMQPYWEEETQLVVSHEEVDAEEFLRVTLWDSDRFTADDDLGRIEIELKELMKNDKSNGKMWKRNDTFEALRAGEVMPGRLEWSVGYYPKVRLLDSQVAHNPPVNSVTTVEQLKEHSFKQSTRKLRETRRDESSEIDQLKKQDFEEICTETITQSIPTQTFPSGILSIQIHQITGLELETLNRERGEDAGGETEDGEEESGEGLPDSYCIISINHQRIFKTRTKPKNSKPFFNAGTERFIRDWRNASVFVAVRDARVHEDDPLLGIVHLDLNSIFRQKGASRFNGFFPLTGGIGYGRIRLSVVFRSIQLQPRLQDLGWEYGTLEVSPEVECSGDFQADLKANRIKFRTPMAKGKFYANASSTSENQSQPASKGATWTTRNDISLRLPVRNRYSVPLVIEFRSHGFIRDSTNAFGVFWLHNIPDGEKCALSIPIFKGDLQRAEVNCLPESEMGEKVGSLKVKLTFWRGLGRWHSPFAGKDIHMSQMMEVIQCARDNGLIDTIVGDEEWLMRHDDPGKSEVADDSDSDSDSDDKEDKQTAEEEIESANRENKDSEKSIGGFMNEAKRYKRQKGQLHERHRGIMQWKAPRMLHSLKNKAEQGMNRLSGSFEHTDRVPDLETEV